MEALPDNVLLEVLQYLDIADLLTCRLVCRRVGALAMLPEVWRHQWMDFEWVFDEDHPPYNDCSVLRLAPCLDLWEVMVPLGQSYTLYTTTRCAVNTLLLNIDEMEGKDALQVSLLIRNQEALGRLRSLRFSSQAWQSKVGAEYAAVLLGTLASTSDLEELELSGLDCYPHPPSALAGLHRSFPDASLKSFQHNLESLKAEPFCEFILSTHAATLESVNLGGYHFTSTSTAALLAGMPNLRRLQCGMMPGLEAVAGCDLLRDLELAYYGEALAAAEFLRRATQLVKVKLDYQPQVGLAPSPDKDVVLALAATEHSCLERLSISNRFQKHFPEQQSLLKALPRLPALKHLELDAWGGATDELLLGITPANAPALRTLKVYERGVKCDCAHDTLHRDAVQKLLALNPQLKFSIYRRSYCYTDDRCEWCSLGCHQEMRDDSDPPPTYYSADYVTIPRL